MKFEAKKVLVVVGIVFILINALGCVAVKEKAEYFWDKIKGEQSEKQIRTREEAVQEYKYGGFTDVIIVRTPAIMPDVVNPGDKVRQEIQFTMLSPQKEKRFIVSETVSLSGKKDTIELVKRVSEKIQGTHISILQFVIPKDLERGEYKLTTTISAGNQKKTVRGSFRVRSQL